MIVSVSPGGRRLDSRNAKDQGFCQVRNERNNSDPKTNDTILKSWSKAEAHMLGGRLLDQRITKQHDLVILLPYGAPLFISD